MTQTNHSIEPLRAQGGLRRLRRGDLASQRELTSTVITRAQFRASLQTEIDRAIAEDLTLLVASLRIRPVPGQQGDNLKGRDLPKDLVERIRSVNDNLRVAVVDDGEMMLLLPAVRRRPDGESVIHNLREALTPPLSVDGLDHHLSPLIGAAMLGHESPSADLLIDGARLALIECDKGNPAMMFHPYQRVRRERRSEMQSDLRRAVLAGEVEAALQPAFTIESGTLVAFEAFARWNRTGKGPVPAWEFVTLAKEIGVGHLLSQQVLRKAVAAISENRVARPDGSAETTLWLNVSPEDLLHPDFASLIVDAIETDDQIRVGLELSPSPDAEAREIHQALKRLVSRGARAAIGDFGIGNANLNILQQLPFDAVKLDRTLIRQIAGNAEAADLVGALLGMAELLNLETTAQGIETQGQLDVVAGLACHIGQGYFFAEPTLDRHELQSWFRSGNTDQKAAM